jgi:hypothetical protein
MAYHNFNIFGEIYRISTSGILYRPIKGGFMPVSPYFIESYKGYIRWESGIEPSDPLHQCTALERWLDRHPLVVESQWGEKITVTRRDYRGKEMTYSLSASSVVRS